MKPLVLGMLIGAGATGAAVGVKDLISDAPGAKSYFVQALDVQQKSLDDGGTFVSVTAYATASVVLKDGGVSQTDLGATPCPLAKADDTALRTVITACTPK